MYKIETHLHTKPVSTCSFLTPTEMIGLYADAGYNTVFVSDHLDPGYFAALCPDGSWERYIGLFFDAYGEAKAAGETHGMTVLFSPEISLGRDHFLLYGADREKLLARPRLFDASPEELYAYAKSFGGYVVQAHPYRDGICVPHPDAVDGFEVVNANPRHENFDERAIALAREHGKWMTAGSDAHRPGDVAGAAVLAETPVTCTEDYIRLLKSGKAKLMRRGEIVL